MSKTFKQTLLEKKEKEEKPKPIIFKETDPLEEFPKDTMNYLQKEINKKCKDLEIEWKDALELLNSVFADYDIPLPKVYQTKRWEQYSELIKHTVKNLRDARGMKGSWVRTV